MKLVMCDHHKTCSNNECYHIEPHDELSACEEAFCSSVNESVECCLIEYESIECLPTIVSIAFDTSDKINDNRTLLNILSQLMQEVGELSTEISIDAGFLNREPGEDGILGEAIDAINCLLDTIKIKYPSITEQQLNDIMKIKCNKWIASRKDFMV